MSSADNGVRYAACIAGGSTGMGACAQQSDIMSGTKNVDAAGASIGVCVCVSIGTDIGTDIGIGA